LQGNDQSASCLDHLTSWQKNPSKYPLNRRPDGPWSRSECFVEEENLLPLQGIGTQFFRCPAHSLVTMLTILPQLLDRPKRKWNFPLQNKDF